jgi:hypothetical protein
MYYPLLRGRQFELIALRELGSENDALNNINPIVEPVKESFNTLDTLNTVFINNNKNIYYILNPNAGHFETHDTTPLIDFFLRINNNNIKPAFYVTKKNINIKNCIDEYELTNVLLLCSNEIDVNKQSIKDLFQQPQVTSICVLDPGRNRTLSRYIKGINKEFIRQDDLFEKEDRNSDYLNIPEHLFSEEHIYYKEEGFHGFSDFTVLPSEFIEGGSTPRAVVIHFTFLNHDNQIRIKHFTSNSNDSIANVQGKFAEALKKTITFCRQQQLNNTAIDELEHYYKTQHYPGLGIVKKLSIKNHLLVVSQFLNQQ